MPKKPSIPIALEMYSVRKEFTVDPLGTMRAIKKMGYAGVEFAGDPQFCPEFYAALLKETGLVCCGWHTSWARVQPDTLAETVRLNQTVGNKYIIIPWLDGTTHDDWLALAKQMNDLADKLAVYGMRCGYHNHAGDFKPVDGRPTWDTFINNTYKKVVMQLDLGNAMAGGAAVMPILEANPGRCQTIHLKPYSLDPAKGYRPLIGEDDVDWPAVYEFCQTKGDTEWAIVEYECPELPALEAVEKCLQALVRMNWR